MSVAGFVSVIFFLLVFVACAGIKKIILKIVDFYDWMCDLERRRMIREYERKENEKAEKYHHMNVISFTHGKCDICGK